MGCQCLWCKSQGRVEETSEQKLHRLVVMAERHVGRRPKRDPLREGDRVRALGTEIKGTVETVSASAIKVRWDVQHCLEPDWYSKPGGPLVRLVPARQELEEIS